MYSSALLLSAYLVAATSLPTVGTTTYFPTMWAGDSSSGSSVSTVTSIPTIDPRAPPPKPLPMKTLSLCCCCLARPPYAFEEPSPPPAYYVGDCSKAGTRDVCGDDYTGSSGFVMGGLEGQTEKIRARCSVSRCGAMRFVD